jgi:uncharacterized protein involved in exopolysaccharide biosynthesis
VENYAFGGMNQGNFISNQIEEMKTELFAEDVYSELSAEHKNRFLQLSSFRPSMNAESFVISQIKNSLSFTPIRGTEIINIGFDTEKPDLAQVVANTTAEVVITRNLRMRRQQFSNVKDFVDEQFEIVQRRLAAAENSLKEFKERQKITSIEGESREILQRSTKAEIVYNEVKTTKNELQERLAAIQEQLRSEKRDLTKNVVNTTSPMAAKLKEQLVEMEITYSNLQVQGFPLSNSKMIDLKNEIEQVKQTLVQETLKINQDENMESLIDPFSQIRKHMEESIALEVELQAAKAKEANLEALLARYARVLRQLPAKELTLVRLLRDKEVNQSLYMTLVQEREKARINEASEIGSIRILESASLPASPIRPRKALNIAVAVLAGCFLGIAFIFVLEYLNDKIRSSDDVERDIGFPVIAVIPKNKKDLDGIFSPDKNGRLGTTSFYDSIFFDAYNLLSFALDKNQNTAKTVMVTSATPNEGKTSISSMLAITSAQRGKRTLLIDADLRKPSLDAYFRVPREPGLTNLVIEIMQMQRRQRPVGRNGHQALPPPINHNGHDNQLVQHQMIQAALVEGLVQTFVKSGQSLVIRCLEYHLSSLEQHSGPDHYRRASYHWSRRDHHDGRTRGEYPPLYRRRRR